MAVVGKDLAGGEPGPYAVGCCRATAWGVTCLEIVREHDHVLFYGKLRRGMGARKKSPRNNFRGVPVFDQSGGAKD